MNYIENQDDKYRIGKSRNQGANGVMQGNQGAKSQVIKPNSIINSIAKPTNYYTPKITHRLTSQEGFNEALSVIGARNNAKLDMQNRKVMSGVLGSLLSANASKYGSDKRLQSRILEDKTRRRGQDLTVTDNANKLAQTATRDNNTKAYYDGLLSNQKEGNRIKEIKANAPKTYKPMNPIDEKIKLQKIVNSDNFLEGIYGEELAGEFTDSQKIEIKQQFMKDKTVPNYQLDEGFFNDTTKGGGEAIDPYGFYKGGQPPQVAKPNQSQGQEPKPQEQKSMATGKLLDAVAKDSQIDRSELKISDDGLAIIFPDGSSSPIDAISKSLGI